MIITRERVSETMRKIFLLFGCLLFLTACGTWYSSQEADPYRSGTDGVEVSFYGSDFTYYDQEYMQLNLLLQNKGAYDEPQGKVVLSGYDANVVKISDEEIYLPDEFYGKNMYNQDGTLYFVEVQEDGPLTVELGETYEFPLQASVCYSYQTIATPTACLLYNPEDTFICTQDTISLYSQGGPVAVDKVEQHYMQDQVRFTVYVEHVGDGTVVNAYDVDAYEACPFLLEKDDLNHVSVEMEISGLGEPSCIPNNGYIKLNDIGQGTIVCTFTLREQRSYTTPLKITLDYQYLLTESQNILIGESADPADRETAGYNPYDSSGSDDVDSSGGCYCSEANMKAWGGCVCLYIDGQMHYCLEGSTEIPVSANAGDTISYVVRGSSTVNKCGGTSSPTTDCPFTGTTTVPKKLSIYGTTTDGNGVSERCNLVIS